MKKNIALILLSMLTIMPAFAKDLSEPEKIEYLLKAIGESDVVFIRNGDEHPATEAQSHLRTKLKNAGEKIKTAEDFIIYLASKSSMTGKPYYMKFKNGTQIEAGIWLHEKLHLVEEKK